MGDRNYNFPGTPYASQKKLMDALYESMECGTIGMFESPTGTGKTLALICAASTFLIAERSLRDEVSVDGDDWVSAHASQKEMAEKRNDLRELTERRRRREANVLTGTTKGRRNITAARPFHRKKRHTMAIAPEGEQRFILDDLHHDSGPSVAEELYSDDESGDDDDKEEKPPVPRENLQRPPLRIVFATRTHSQLSQFIAEFRKTSFGADTLKMNRLEYESFQKPMSTSPGSDLPISVVLFGSRKHLCVNENVRALENSSAINEKCRELNDKQVQQKPTVGLKRTVAKRNSSKGCPYRNKEAERELRDRSIVQLHSAEELENVANQLSACPYYASRAAIDSNDVDIIGVPYSAVLHAPTRSAIGLTIDTNTIVIFDEAHNLVDTVCDLNSTSLTKTALCTTLGAMERYTERYITRLTPANLFSMRQLMAVARGLIALLNQQDSSKNARVLNTSGALFEAKIDNVNMYELVEFVKKSKLSHKLRGFVEHSSRVEAPQSSLLKPNVTRKGDKRTLNSEVEGESVVKHIVSGIPSFETFLSALADCPKYGRIAIYPSTAEKPSEASNGNGDFVSTSRLRFFVLEPGALFASAVKDARAVLMLGGTLSPRAALKHRLFKDLGDRTITEFECDHVVPAKNVCAVVCETGPSKFPLEFTYRSRQNSATIDELGRASLSLVRTVSGGVVVFFTSYDFLSQVKKRWSESGILSSLQQLKPTFFESRGDTCIFSKYQAVVSEAPKRGALLGAVMGGRLSEGINFSDELGRMVVIVGLPFANASNVEMAEVLRGLTGKKEQSELLTNSCLTSVNQSIGRAVRHAKDYASIVFMDRRYARPRIQDKLPAFVRRNFRSCSNFNDAMGEISGFFRNDFQQ